MSLNNRHDVMIGIIHTNFQAKIKNKHSQKLMDGTCPAHPAARPEADVIIKRFIIHAQL